MAPTKCMVLMECLNEIDDQRKVNNLTRHDFWEMLVMAIAGVHSDCDRVEDIVARAHSREQWLCPAVSTLGVRRFLLLKNGVPSEDTFLHSFACLIQGNSKPASGAG